MTHHSEIGLVRRLSGVTARHMPMKDPIPQQGQQKRRQCPPEQPGIRYDNQNGHEMICPQRRNAFFEETVCCQRVSIDAEVFEKSHCLAIQPRSLEYICMVTELPGIAVFQGMEVVAKVAPWSKPERQGPRRVMKADRGYSVFFRWCADPGSAAFEHRPVCRA